MYALGPEQTEAAQPVAANDHIQIALIGAGGQGQGDTKVALRIPGVKLVAVADCYNGRLAHAKELWGDDVFTTRDYKEILARKDVDAVIIGTPDHWHKQASVDAMKAGKDVYCEKPMIHLYSDGPEIIETARATKRIIQIGSQRVSSQIYIKAKELLAAGAIGQLNMVTARWDRNSSIGAWNYTVPLDALPETCDWPRFEATTAIFSVYPSAPVSIILLTSGTFRAGFIDAPAGADQNNDYLVWGVTLADCPDCRTQNVPEPVTLSLVGAGLLGAAVLRRRRKKSD